MADKPSDDKQATAASESRSKKTARTLAGHAFTTPDGLPNLTSTPVPVTAEQAKKLTDLAREVGVTVHIDETE